MPDKPAVLINQLTVAHEKHDALLAALKQNIDTGGQHLDQTESDQAHLHAGRGQHLPLLRGGLFRGRRLDARRCGDNGLFP